MTAATKNVSVKLDSKLYTALKTRAELNNSNVSDEIRSLLRSALAAEELDLYGNEVAGRGAGGGRGCRAPFPQRGGGVHAGGGARRVGRAPHSKAPQRATPPRTASPRSSRAP